MQYLTFLVFATLAAGPVLAQAKNEEAEAEIGKSVVEAIATNDIVAYSQFWVSVRQAKQNVKTLGLELETENEFRDMPDHFAKRNSVVAESFRQIQELINRRKIDRRDIKFQSCVARGVQEIKTPKGIFKNAGGFYVLMRVKTTEWKLEIDDGVMVDGIWYFCDKPIQLDAGDDNLNFGDFKGDSPQ